MKCNQPNQTNHCEASLASCRSLARNLGVGKRRRSNGRAKSRAKGWVSGLLLSLIAVSAITGCKTSQDPLANQSAQVRNGVPPELATPAPAVKPLREDALLIDSKNFYSFKVGVAGSFSLSGRVLEPVNGHDPVLGQDYEIGIKNLSDFPGATFDSTTGEFVWTPDRLTDDSQYQESRILTVTIHTNTSPVLSKDKDIELFVARQENAPTIVSISNDLNADPFIREGESRQFTVLVQDPDSKDLDGMRPKINSIRATDSKDVSYLVSMIPSDWNSKNPTIDPTNSNRWLFKMRLNLVGQEVTHSSELFSFGIQVVSRYGRTAQLTSNVTIQTSIGKSVVSWLDNSPLAVVAGVENVINFTAYDPQGEGNVQFFWGSANWRCDMLPGSASCSCVSQDTSNSSQLCTLRWKIPLDVKITDATVEGEIFNRSKILNDPKFDHQIFKRRLKIVPGTAPVPTPVPTPVATPAPTPGPVSSPAPVPSSKP